eukprot:TRINITY_DN782097_c0_g1_i1.p1 TRINITY_DN782097_c0_g1~~TRINITY_DN782097_c0_g1_i1.p1  ORF type:complete len:238 (-),score=21.88 TRINITY_DN782097_c0_g1_i1:305-1018(-)
MGGICSAKVDIEMDVPLTEDAHRDFSALELERKDIGRFYHTFCLIDTDRSGEIDLDEFYDHMRIERTPFSDRVFSLLDEDKNGFIDFREFVISTWNYCTFDFPNLIKFCFKLFDQDDSGDLEINEVVDLVKEVYGNSYENNSRVKALMSQLDADGDGDVSFPEFEKFNRQHPALLFPAYCIQQTLRRRLFGTDFWKAQSKSRQELGGGRTKTIFELLDRMNAELMRHAVTAASTVPH